MSNTGAEYIVYKFKKIQLKVNGKVIIGKDENTSVSNYDFVSYRLAHQIQNALGEEKVKSIEISDLDASSEAVNQLLRLLVKLNFAEEGLEGLYLYGWHSGME